MASFLSVQLLEKVMAETMKPEGESKMDLEVVERITKALQMSSEPSSDKAISSPDKTTAIGEETTIAAEIPISTPVESAESRVHETSAQTTEDDESGTTAEIETLEQSKNEDKEQHEVMQAEANAVSPAVKIPSRSLSIPEIKVKPLEVVQSNIPALRPESVPQRKPDDKVVEDKNDTVGDNLGEEILSVESKAVADKPCTSEESAVPLQSTSSDEIDTAAVFERKKAEESFHRKLLKQKLEYDNSRAVRIGNEQDSCLEVQTEVDSVSTPPPEVPSDEMTQENETSSANTATQEEIETVFETTQSSESTASIENAEGDDEDKAEVETEETVVSELIQAEDEMQEEPAPPTATTAPSLSPKISERRVETIVALRQPKSSVEESKLAEKYAQMSLEDRAYALLCDLGMIEEHKDPNDPSYDHSKDDEYCEQRFFPLL